jgi:hypothetical protein
MATTQQLEKQKQDLLNLLNQITNDPNIPVSDKVPIMKELSRTMVNISEQINKMTVPVVTPKETRKEEIKQIMKEKKELQPLGIPEKVEKGVWRMEEVIKVVKLDLSKIDYTRESEGWGVYIDWDRFWDQARPILLKEIKQIMEASNFKFPIVLQTSLKVMCTTTSKPGEPLNTTYAGHRTDSISNIKHVANNEEQIAKVLEDQLDEVLRKTQILEGSDVAVHDIVSYHVRFWEYRPSVIRRATSLFARGNGYIETPKWLQNRRAIINIKNTDNQYFIKCLYRAINYDSKNRNNNRDVNHEELEAFKKQFNCRSIGDDYVDVG